MRGRDELSRAWLAGWAVGTVVVAIAAGLLVAIIALCRRIVGQGEDVVRALDGAREHTSALFEVTAVSHTLDGITRSLAAVREEAGA